jgi:hypothetical protein
MFGFFIGIFVLLLCSALVLEPSSFVFFVATFWLRPCQGVGIADLMIGPKKLLATLLWLITLSILN